MNRNSRHILIGAWTWGLYDSESKTLNVRLLHNFEKNIGKKVALAHIYLGWHEIDSDSFLSTLNELHKNDWVPMVSANPYFFDRCKPSVVSLYKTIAQGKCDDFIHAMAKRMRTFKYVILFRFAWEMNIPANEWSLEYTQSDPKDFIAAWRHIHDIFLEEKALNVRWVFCPLVMESESHEFAHLYPGDAYVDWVGLDGYNWGTTQSWSAWKSFYDIFYPSYKQLESIAPSKPVMIGEVGSTDVGGNKAAWFSDMLSEKITQSFPNMRAIVFYNEDRTKTEHVNWTIQPFSQAMDAIQKAMENNIFVSDFIENK